MPAEQGVHTESPALSPYVPAAHARHALDRLADVVAELGPAAHGWHTLDTLADVVAE